MNPKTCLITIGFTHSGKTTLANKLCEHYRELTNIDTDDIRTWAKASVPQILYSEHNTNQAKVPLGSLIFQLMKTLGEFAFKTGLPVLFSNGNLISHNVEWMKEVAQRYDYQIITLYLDTPEETILERLANSNRSSSPLITSNNYHEVYDRQKNYADFEFLQEIKKTSIVITPETTISEVIQKIELYSI
jgi:adenylate kinase family enzyme